MSTADITLTSNQIIDRICQAIVPLYDPREAKNIATMAAAHIIGCEEKELKIEPNKGYTINAQPLQEAIDNLRRGQPIQHFIGQAYFYDRYFGVDHNVLIPRPETEELVDWIIKSHSHAHTILDVGTGSGCIAATLALELPQARVYAADKSIPALNRAADNCKKLGANVTFRQADALQNLEMVFPEQFDLIVSNPPYIPAKDRESMHINVVEHEPEMALFVPDNDPIIFYRAVAISALKMLSCGGYLFFEIYAPAAQIIVEMLTNQGYKDIEIREDLSSKPRMICCRRG